MADLKNMQELEKLYGSSTVIDDATLQKFLNGTPQSWSDALTPGNYLFGSGMGAQNQAYVYQKLDALTKLADQKYKDQVAQLKAINPNFDPAKYIDPTYQLYGGSEGASANMYAPVEQLGNKLKAQQEAIQAAKEAAQKFQATGQIDPYPDYTQKIQSILGNAQASGSNQIVAKAKNLLTGAAITPDIMAEANASAARVGAPLPYPNASVGAIAPGGIITNQQLQTGLAQGMDYSKVISQAQAGAYASLDTLPIQNQNNTNSTTTQVASNSNGTQIASSQNPQVDNLVKQALMGGNLNNLQGQQFWAGADPAVKTQAYAQLQKLMQDPAQLGQFVVKNGITNLQNYDWWNSNPKKSEAWAVVQGIQNSPTNVIATNTGTSAMPGSSTSQVALAGGQTDQASIQAALDIINNSNLDEHTKDLYTQAVKNWNPGQDVNIPNILKTFSEVQSKTIDPYYKEMTGNLIDQFSRAAQYQTASRGQELEQEGVNANQNIKGAQNNLEASGMTFSGKGVELLGKGSAYAQPGQNPDSMIPNQTPFGGQFAEGLINQQNRLISSSSSSRYQQALTDLSRQAEQKLGTAGSTGIVTGVTQLGGVIGDVARQKQGDQQNALSGIAAQQKTNTTAQTQPFNPFNT